jgi:hypothetical protein
MDGDGWMETKLEIVFGRIDLLGNRKQGNPKNLNEEWMLRHTIVALYRV